MKTYHLHIKDNDAAEYDGHYFYTHPTKNATSLWEDYNNAYGFVVDNDKEWDMMAILRKLNDFGWTRVEIEKVEVEY